MGIVQVLHPEDLELAHGLCAQLLKGRADMMRFSNVLTHRSDMTLKCECLMRIGKKATTLSLDAQMGPGKKMGKINGTTI